MLLKLTEQFTGIVNPETIITNEIVINTQYIQSVKKVKPQYPFNEEYSMILMASGHTYNVKENFDYIYTKMQKDEITRKRNNK